MTVTYDRMQAVLQLLLEPSVISSEQELLFQACKQESLTFDNQCSLTYAHATQTNKPNTFCVSL